MRSFLLPFLLISLGCQTLEETAVQQEVNPGLARKACPKEARVCIQVYRPKSCFVNVKGQKIEFKGANTCDARNKLWKKVCATYPDLRVDQVQATQCVSLSN